MEIEQPKIQNINEWRMIEDAIKRIKKAGTQLQDDEIVGRQEQKQKIEEHIQQFIKKPEVTVLFINGTTGTGKTMLVTNLLTKYKDQIEFFYANAMQETSMDTIVYKMNYQANPRKNKQYPMKIPKKTEKAYENFASNLKKSPKKMIAVIDEYDAYADKQQKIYTFVDWMFNNQPQLMVIFISNHSQSAIELHSRVQSRFTPINFDFTNYKREEIENIIYTRIGKEVIFKIFDPKDFEYFMNVSLFDTLNSGDVRKAMGMMLNVLISAQDRIENGKPLKLEKRQTGELTRSMNSVQRLTTCTQFEIIVLYCIMKCNMNEEIGYENLMMYLDGISQMKKDLVDWNETIVRSCVLRLEKKQMISISTENGVASFNSNILDRENVQILMQKITGNKTFNFFPSQ